ncbi:MAG: 16S rRNA (cytidine(1402)-2'-O)-methyltransferase [Bacteroidia bacterium]|nr:16S rRNA (cytidine(1402)-2'-O)-methyltransferase [Bacteroidia bacterium]
MQGMLYVIPTPVGNLEDITLRALRLLKECDVVLAEDTRVTQKLLTHYQIQKPLFAYHKDNEHAQTQKWLSRLMEGKKICLVSDAGTPGISDPGFYIIRACLERQIPTQVLPGPTAFVPALVNSGLPTDAFTFLGFIPHKKGRKKFLESVAQSLYTSVFYESTHRIKKLAVEMLQSLPEGRKVCFAKEISKIHEKYFRGSVGEICRQLMEEDERGEWVVMVEPKKNNKHEPQ